MLTWNEELVYDIYLNGKNDLLVVPRGHPVPTHLTGNWKRKKRAVRSVSEKIREACNAAATIADGWSKVDRR
ncbi:hypothetical protein SAMN05444164_3334 [Bradyrhizobium erythrophlei]|uniref:Uncharacterized protein n=1 Tax=Bradyrhizobium erythrophlei TaxID=1437360 RepID=A0A1H4X100_9BRAD|nr:hypothetical protein SAMN05444164_3334 [Bradyrhizobium erythrophlei]